MSLRRRLGVGLVALAVMGVLAVGGFAGTTAAANEPVDLDPDTDLAGEGVDGDPYIITNASELQAMEGNLSAHYRLGNDINASETEEWNGGKGFDPIGDSGAKFTGTFNGSEHTISELSINRSGDSTIGLFGYTENGVLIERVGLEAVTIHGNRDVGGLVANNFGEVSESYVTGTVDGGDYVGGLVANNIGEVSESYATGTVDGDDRVGGLVGYNYDGANVSASYATGSVNGTNYVGGLVANNIGEVNESYATGSVDGASDVGGLVGEHDGDVTDSYWDIESTGQSSAFGTNVGTGDPTGLTTDEMTGINATVRMSTFDFASTWRPGDGDEQYPDLARDSEFSDTADAYDSLVAGDGSSGDPYNVTTVYELQRMDTHLDDDFQLQNDIDASGTDTWNGGKGFDPIGDSGAKFTGTFDGDGHTISDLIITRESEANVGLFGAVGSAGTITTLSVTNADVTGDVVVGGVVAANDGEVRRSSVSGSVVGTGSKTNVGGLVGSNNGVVNDSYATSTVDGGTTTGATGGLVGLNDKTITGSYAIGLVNDGNSGGAIGGLVGDNNDKVERSYWDSETTGQGSSAGGVGLNTSEMEGLNATVEMHRLDFDSVWRPGDGDYPDLARDSEFSDTADAFDSLVAGDGGGTPYQITTVYELQRVDTHLNDEFELQNDINASGTSNWDDGNGFDPLGDSVTKFTGTFDGAGHTISNLTIARGSTDYVGLFGYTDNGVVATVGLPDASVTGQNSVGGVVGHARNDAVVRESFVSGTVSGGDYVGGLVGENGEASSAATVEDSYSLADVTGANSVGGVVGEEQNSAPIPLTVKRSYAAGDVTITSGSSVGGIAGSNIGNVEDSYWDRGITNQQNAIGGSDPGASRSNLTGYGSTGDSSPASEMQRFAPQVNMDLLDFSSTWTLTSGYPALAWESVDELTVDSVEATDTTTTAGTETEINVTANEGGTNAGEGVTVRVITNDSLAGLPVGNTSVTDANGNATFAFNETAAADYALEFAWDDDTTVSDTATVTVAPDNATTVSVDSQPTNSKAGTAIAGPPRANVTDQFGNPVDGVTVTVAEEGGYSFDSGTTTNTTTDGITAFNDLLINESADDYRLNFSINASDAGVDADANILTDTFNMTAADAGSLDISSAPSAITAGDSVTLTINATDEFGNSAADQMLTDFEIGSEFDGTVFGQTDITLNSTGQYEATISTNTVGTANESHTLTADASGPTGDSVDITVEPANATTVSVDSQPAESTAGEAIAGLPRANVTDQFGNPVDGVTVTVSEEGGYSFDSGTLTNTTTEGVTTFDDLFINESATDYRLNVSISAVESGVDTTANTLTDTFNVTAAAADSLRISDAPQSVDAGAGFNVTINATDEFDNLAADQSLSNFEIGSEFDGTVLGPKPIMLNGTGAAEVTIAADTVTTANDSHTLTATADGLTDDSVDIEVSKTDADTVTVDTQPVSTTANDSIGSPPTVSVTDASGNDLAGVTVTAALNGSSTLLGTTAVDTNDTGVAVFDDLRVQETGSYNLTLAVSDDSTVNATTNAFEITAADAASISVDSQPTASTAGEAIAGPPEANVTDAFDNPVAGENVTVTINESVGLGGSTEIETASAGIASFSDLNVTESGTYELVFELTDDGSVTTTTAAFEVAAANATSITVDTQPTDTTAGETIGGPPTATVTDQFDNPVAGVAVNISEEGGYSFDSGTTTEQTGANGLVTFGDLVVEQPGQYRLNASISETDTNVSTADSQLTTTFAISAEPNNNDNSGGSGRGSSSEDETSEPDQATVVAGQPSDDGAIGFTVSDPDGNGEIVLSLDETDGEDGDAEGTDTDSAGDSDQQDDANGGTAERSVEVDSISVRPTDIGSREFDINVRQWAVDNDGGSDSDDGASPAGDEEPSRTDPRVFLTETGSSAIGYVEVTHSNTDEEIDGVTFRFRVRSSYLDEQNVDPEEVSLYRDETDRWKELDATEVETTDSHHVYEAESPGLSVFAVGVPEPTDTAETTDTRQEPEQSTDDSEPQTDSEIPGFGIPAAVIALLVTLGLTWGRSLSR